MANKIFKAIEGALLFADAAQAETEILTLSALAAGAGRVSARHDFGAASNSRLFEMRATIQWGTNPVTGESIDIYMATSDGTNPDGEIGVVDAALSAEDNLKNLHYLGSVIAPDAGKEVDRTASGFFNLNARYASVVVFNNSADALKTDTAVHGIKLTPVPDEVQ